MNWKLVAAAVALAATPVNAAEEANPGRCEMSSAWGDIEGRNPTVMLVRQDQDDFDDHDSVIVAFFNDDWSISKDQKLGRIRVTASDDGWFENEASAMEHGFLIFASFKNVSNVFDDYPSAMIVTRQGKTVDKLSLTGVWSDWSKFKDCRSKKVVVFEELKPKERLQKEIPKDPFSSLKGDEGSRTPPR